MGRQPNNKKLPTLPKKTNRLQPQRVPLSPHEEPNLKNADLQVIAKDKHKRREDRTRRHDRLSADKMIFVKPWL